MQVESGVYALPAPLPLECDELMLGAEIAFETYGKLNAGGDNAILFLHDLARSPRAASGTPASAERPYSPEAWLSGLVGEGKPFDPARYFIVSADLLGSPWGSTSPRSINPENGSPYGVDFFRLGLKDHARAASTLCRARLGIPKLRAVIGVSLGGMVALQLAALFPESVRSVAALACSAALPDSFRRKYATVRSVLEANRAFRDGESDGASSVVETLKRIRLDHLRSLYSSDYLSEEWGDAFAADRALESEAEAFARAFDARCYATLCETFARADLHSQLGLVRSRALLFASSSDELAPPQRVRDTYHRLMAGGASARYHELVSSAGHEAFRVHALKAGEVLREFVGTPTG